MWPITHNVLRLYIKHLRRIDLWLDYNCKWFVGIKWRGRSLLFGWLLLLVCVFVVLFCFVLCVVGFFYWFFLYIYFFFGSCFIFCGVFQL